MKSNEINSNPFIDNEEVLGSDVEVEVDPNMVQVEKLVVLV